MVRRRRVLEFIGEETRRGATVSAEGLYKAYFLSLSREAARAHLERLWRERLIEAVPWRPKRFHFRLRPGERFRDLHFRLSSRGEERLRWYREQEESSGWPV